MLANNGLLITTVHKRREYLTSICPIKNEPVKYSKLKRLPSKFKVLLIGIDFTKHKPN